MQKISLKRNSRHIAIYGLYFYGKDPKHLIEVMPKSLKEQIHVIKLQIGDPESKSENLGEIWRPTSKFDN